MTTQRVIVHLIFLAAFLLMAHIFVKHGYARELFLLQMEPVRALRHFGEFSAWGVCYWACLWKTRRWIQTALCGTVLLLSTVLGFHMSDPDFSGHPLWIMFAVVPAFTILRPMAIGETGHVAPDAPPPPVGLTLPYGLFMGFCYFYLLVMVTQNVHAVSIDTHSLMGDPYTILVVAPSSFVLFFMTLFRIAQLPRWLLLVGLAPFPLFLITLICMFR